MTTILKNTTIAGTGHLTIPVGTTNQRPAVNTSIIQWTNTGSQAYSVLSGPTPTLTNTTWTAPAGVNTVEVLVVAGGGQGGNIAGGGAGGVIYNSNFSVTPGTAYTVTVGAGGSTSPGASVGQNGSNSVFNNLITNGTFTTNTTGWTAHPDYATTVLSIDTNRLKVLGGGAQQSFSTEIGKIYVLAYTLTAFNPGGVYLGTASTGANGFSYFSTGSQSTGIYSYTFTATSTTAYVTLFAWNAGSQYAFYDDVSVSEVGLTAIGGGGGAGSSSPYPGLTGGSGGAGGGDDGTNGVGGSATAGQGYPGGTSLTTGTNFGGGGGGGAGGAGSNASTINVAGGGGNGLNFSIVGTPTWYAGGGGGGAYIISSTGTRGIGGVGGGGAGGQNGTNATNGTASTGSGGGGNGLNSSGSLQGSPGTGGSGVVILRYASLSDGTDTRAVVRYNTDLRDVELYEGPATGWTAQDTARNFIGHNLIKYSDQLETSPPDTASNGQTFHWTQGGSSIQTTTVAPPINTYSPVTWNVLDQGPYQQSKDNNLTAFSTVSGWYYQRATVGVTSGKWYWESTTSVTSGTYYVLVGLASYSSPTNNGHMGANAANIFSYGYGSNTGNKHNNGSAVAYGSAFQTVGDVVGIAFDADNGTLTFYKNGVSQGQAYSGITGQGPYYPAIACYASTAYNNFGATPFKHSIPAGYSPWNQARSVTKLNSPASGNGYGFINSNWLSAISVTVGKTYTFSIFARAAEWTRLSVRIYDGANYFIRTTVNVSTGTLVSANEVGTTTIVPYGNGWYRVIITGVCSNTANVQPIIECHNVATVQTDEPSNGGGIYIYGAQFEEGTGSPFMFTKTNSAPIPTVLNGYRTHTYTTVGTSGFTPTVTGNVEVLVVAGGGGGSNYNSAGGGGAGGLIYRPTYPVIAGRSYTVTVGTGGVGAMTLSGTHTDAIASATSGSNSQFGTLIAIGGGHGGQGNVQGSRTDQFPSAGGSGGGTRDASYPVGAAGTAGQGNKGGNSGTYSGNYPGGGGGGAGAPGGDGNDTVIAGEGGAGLQYSISGTPTYYAGGGGGSTQGSGTTTLGGLGGGGAGGGGTGGSTQNGVSGTANTGGGGGAGGYNNSQSVGGNGGSGVVIVRYRYD